MKNWKGSLIGILFVLILWYSADIVTLGLSLNEQLPLCPYIGGGTVLWGVIVLIIFWIFILPIIAFCRMKHVTFDERYKAALRDLKPYYDQKPKDNPKHALYHKMQLSGLSEQKKKEYLEKYAEIGDIPKKARRLIMSYSKASGVLVAYSRSKFMDSFVLLAMQVLLVMNIARLHGYKPSPVFNVCCFVWVCANSIFALFMQDIAIKVGELVESGVDDVVGDFLPELTEETVSSNMEGAAMEGGTQSALSSVGEALDSIPFVGGLIRVGLKSAGKAAGLVTRLAFEAAVGGAIVYATGYAFLISLEGASLGENKLIAMIQKRREGRRKIFKSLAFSMVPGAKSQIEKADKDIHS